MTFFAGWFLIPIAVGHVAFWIWTVNVLHGLGVNEHNVSRWNMTLFSLGSLASLLLLWSTWQGEWSVVAQAYGLLCLAVGCVALPVTTVLRLVRQHPSGVVFESAEWPMTDRDSYIGEGRYHWMHRLRGNESLRLRRVETTLTLPGLPPALDGLTILHLTDFHFAPCYHRRYFEAVSRAAQEWGVCDLILFTGDMIDNDEGIAWVEPVLGPLTARLGKFAILGNHDLAHDVDGLVASLERAGYTNLEGAWTTVEHQGATLALGGTSTPWGPELDTQAMPESDASIVLSHAPDTFPKFASAGVNLVLAGHNHGGQIRVPILGPIMMPSRFSRRYDRGIFRRGRTLLFVSQGVGGKHPLRFGGCMPEIARVTLRCDVTRVQPEIDYSRVALRSLRKAVEISTARSCEYSKNLSLFQKIRVQKQLVKP